MNPWEVRKWAIEQAVELAKRDGDSYNAGAVVRVANIFERYVSNAEVPR